jgi:hypothetical protein
MNLTGAFSALKALPPTDHVTLFKGNPAYTNEKELSEFKIDGLTYVRKSELATGKKRRHGSSLVWQFGEAIVRKSDKVVLYYCYDCEVSNRKQLLPVLNGTRGALNHMETVHHRDSETGIIKESHMAKQPVFSLIKTADFDVFRMLLLRWFVFCQMALFMLENLFFRELITYLHKGLGSLLPKSQKTLRNWIMEEFEEQKKKLTEELSFSASKIHISFDIWTAGNFVGFMSIWAYWIDASGQRQRRLLAFKRIYGSHTGENQSEVLLEVLKEYNIDDKIGYIVSDNASSNTSAVDMVLYELVPGITAAQIKARRLRCFGHIVNLAAQSLLAGSDAEKRRVKEELEFDDFDFDHQSARWIHQGPVGKLQRLIKYILASSNRREEFGEVKGGRKVEQFDHLGVSVVEKEGVGAGGTFEDPCQASRLDPTAQSDCPICGSYLSSELQFLFEKTTSTDFLFSQLLQDNSTRWNSMHRALGRVLNVKERLMKFIKQHKPPRDSKYRPQDDRLSPAEWTFIERLHTCLEEYYISTNSTEGHTPLVCDYFMTLHYLMNSVDAWQQEARDYLKDKLLQQALQASWLKLEKYYKLTDNTPIYYAAVMLNPMLKTHWFHEAWTTSEQQEWIQPTIAAVRAIWRSEYKHLSTSDNGPQSIDDDTPYNRLQAAKRLKLSSRPSEPLDQFEEYITTDPVVYSGTEFDVTKYWFDRRITHPELSKFALDTLSIPLMADDNERSFSSARDMITYRRTCLQPDIIEGCQCLKNWLTLQLRVNDDEDINNPIDEVDNELDKAFVIGDEL